MPNINDYHAFMSTSGGGGGGASGGGSGGPGCNMGCLGWIIAGIIVLWIIGNLG